MSGSTGEDHIDPPESEAEEAAVDQQARDDAGQFVPAERLQPETVESRRERKQRERFEGYVKPMKEQWDTERTTYQQQIEEERRARQELATETARMRGMIETMQRMPAQQQAAQPVGPDPAELRRKAKELLGAGNIDEYERLHAEANDIVSERKAEARVQKFREEFQRSQPQQLRQDVQNLLFSHRNVAMAGHERGLGVVALKEQELALFQNMPPSPARTAKAFELAEKQLAQAASPQPPSRPAYSTDSREALAGIPTGRPSATAKSDGPGVRLTPAQEQARIAGRFKDAEEYLKWSDPHKFGLVK